MSQKYWYSGSEIVEFVFIKKNDFAKKKYLIKDKVELIVPKENILTCPCNGLQMILIAIIFNQIFPEFFNEATITEQVNNFSLKEWAQIFIPYVHFCQKIFCILWFSLYWKKKVREKSRECHSHKPQPGPSCSKRR